MPKVTVSEAIKIVQSRPSTRLRTSGATSRRTGGGKWHKDPYFDGWEEEHQGYLDARERIAERLGRLRERDDREKEEAGWTRCEVHDTWVPPGWVRSEPL